MNLKNKLKNHDLSFPTSDKKSVEIIVCSGNEMTLGVGSYDDTNCTLVANDESGRKKKKNL